MTPGRDFNPNMVFAVMIVMLAMVLNNSTNVGYDYKGIKLRVIGVAGAVAAPNASSAAPSSVHHSPNKHFVPSSSPSSAGAPVRPSAAARPTLPPSALSPVKGRRSSPLSAAPSPSSVPSPAPSPQLRKPASPQAQPPSTSSIVPVAQTPAEITQENSAVRKISFVTSSVAIPTACAFLLM